MSMPTPSLKEFIELVPVCSKTALIETVLEIFSGGQYNRLVVVSEQQWPLGVLNLCNLMPYLIAYLRERAILPPHFQDPEEGEAQNLEETGISPTSFGLWPNLKQPLSSLELPIIEPLIALPAHITPSQFWSHLQAMQQTKGTSRHWALVDQTGKFLGLLDSWGLLKYLAPRKDEGARKKDETEANCSIHSSYALKPLVQLLEQLPLPLRLQTVAGQVVSQNLTWRQQIAELLAQDEARSLKAVADFAGDLADGLTRKRTDNSSVTSLRVAASVTPFAPPLTEILSDFRLQPDVEADAPIPARTDTAGETFDPHVGCPPVLSHECFAASGSKIVMSTPLAIKAAPAPLGARNVGPPKQETFTPASGKLKNPQDCVFSFFKIPLPDFGLILVLAQDVTEQQQVAKELAAKNADLMQLNRFKDEFLACISHELKTPLTAVLGLSSLLKDQLVGQLNERQLRYAQMIHQSGRTLMTVVNDILDLTRMETGQMELTLEAVNIASVCDRAYFQARQQYLGKDEHAPEIGSEIPFTLDIEAGLETLVADELRLRQMLVHLLSNALKFTDTTGEIGLKVSSWEGWIAFTVWDTGIGIPDTKQHLIFHKFQQLENPLIRQFEGTGLGLVLTQRLARLHGGDVSFISKAGIGSQFTLLLPPGPPHKGVAASEQGNTAVENLATTPPHLSPSLILIVEAVPQYIEDLTEHLIRLGYRVVIARSGTEAIEKARRLQPQAVLLNPLLPSLSGWDVLTLLKSDVQTRHIPLIVTATQAEKELALSNKADSFLTLPVQQEALRQSLTRLTQPLQTTNTSLTILHLSPTLSRGNEEESLLSLLAYSIRPHSEINCRVLEADDLEQAELLARVWHPDVVLLDSGGIDDPLAYLEQLSSHTSLASLPLVTLDHQTTQAANQVTGLSVFPCLAQGLEDNTAALLKVIQVAAGMSCSRHILVVNLATLPDLLAPSGANEKIKSESPQKVEFTLDSSEVKSEKGKVKSKAVPTLHSSVATHSAGDWLQALIQYLQTAGFRSLLSRSWGEVCRELQNQTVDLLLIYLGDVLPERVLFKALTSLENLPVLPPILVLDHRTDANTIISIGDMVNELAFGETESSSELESRLGAVATQILREPPQSMAELLDQINQMLRSRAQSSKSL